MSSLASVGYWDFRGLAEPIRYLLKYAGIDFVDKRYIIEGEPSWPQHKFSLGLDFPNIPYYIDGDLKLTQSLTILRYLARKHGLMATDDSTLARQELVEQQIQDMRESFWELIFEDNYIEKKDKYCTETLIPQLELFVKFLGSNEWLTPKFSYVDILAYETLDWFRLFTPETIEKFPTLGQYLQRFESIPSIKEYRSSPEYKDWPIFGPILKWGWNK